MPLCACCTCVCIYAMAHMWDQRTTLSSLHHRVCSQDQTQITVLVLLTERSQLLPIDERVQEELSYREAGRYLHVTGFLRTCKGREWWLE